MPELTGYLPAGGGSGKLSYADKMAAHRKKRGTKPPTLSDAEKKIRADQLAKAKARPRKGRASPEWELVKPKGGERSYWQRHVPKPKHQFPEPFRRKK